MEKEKRRKIAAQYKEDNAKRDGGIAAIVNTATGERHLIVTRDMAGAKNRFSFFKSTNSCSYSQIAEDWKKYGAAAFEFEVIETLAKKEADSMAKFDEELDALLKLYEEK